MCTAMPRRGTGRPQRAGRARRGSRQVTAALQPVHVPRRRPGRLQLGHREARAHAARAGGLADAGADVEAGGGKLPAGRSQQRAPAVCAARFAGLPPAAAARRLLPPPLAAHFGGFGSWRSLARSSAMRCSSFVFLHLGHAGCVNSLSLAGEHVVPLPVAGGRHRCGGVRGSSSCVCLAWRAACGSEMRKAPDPSLRARGTPGDLASRALQTTLQHLVFCRLTQRVPF